jgi:GT2 family glycosyltransferase
MSDPTVAIIVLNYNTSELTCALASFLSNELNYVNKRVYVIDNGSSEPCMCATHRLAENLFFTRGMYEAWRIAAADAAYDAFWFLNSDVGFEYGTGVLRELVSVLFSKDEYAQIAAQMNSPHTFMEFAESEAQRVPYLEPTATLIKAATIAQIGFWDLGLRCGWGVDYDYGYRVREAGMLNILTSRTRITHKEHKSIADWDAFRSEAASEMYTVLTRKYGIGWERINRMERNFPLILTCCRDVGITERFADSFGSVRHAMEAPRVFVDLSNATRLPGRYLRALESLRPAWIEFHPREPGMNIYDSVQEAATTALAAVLPDSGPQDRILFLEDDILFSSRFGEALTQVKVDSETGFVTMYLPGTGYGSEEIQADQFYGTQCILFSRRAVEQITAGREEMQSTIPPGYDIRWSRYLAAKGFRLRATRESYVQHIGGNSRLHGTTSHASSVFLG